MLPSEQTGEGVILLHLFLLLGMGLYLENCIPIRQTHSHCYCDEHNVDYDTGLVVIDHALLATKSKGVYEGETKTGSMRAIRLAPQSLELLRKWKTEQFRMKLAQGDRWVDSGYIFT